MPDGAILAPEDDGVEVFYKAPELPPPGMVRMFHY
jgi:hypothetical protein